MSGRHATAPSPYLGKRVLVTGGLGFMGHNLVRALQIAGARLSVLSRSWPPEPSNSDSILDGIAFYKGDIRDGALVQEAVTGSDLIFHLAGKSGPVVSNVSPLDDLDVNGRGMLTLLEACRRENPGSKIVFPSSRLVYAAGTSLPVPESAPTVPLSIYGIHKLLAERYLLLYQRLYGLRVSILRITNPYGPFQRPEQNRYGIVNWFIHLAMHDQPIPIYGDGVQIRDYVHIADVIRAMLMAGINSEADGMVFNVGSGRGISVVDMAQLIVRTAGKGALQYVDWPADASKVETGNFVADASLIDSQIGWKVSIAVESGIADLIESYPKLVSTRH